MRSIWLGFYRSFPVQLVLLHIRKYQVLLIFWWIVGSAVAGQFMSGFGADTLFLAPEYRGQVNFLSALFVGMGLGIFIMSWYITTFILFSRYFKFLATTSHPFLKYCLNNAVIPLGFLVFYFIKVYRFERYRELMSHFEIGMMMAGYLIGLITLMVFSFGYFFGANRTIFRELGPPEADADRLRKQYRAWKQPSGRPSHELTRVDWYFTNLIKIKAPRDVSHYSESFLDRVFKRHHFAAILSILLAFLLLMTVGYFMDNPYLQIPAAASILIFFALLIAASAAFVYWLGGWSIPVAGLLLVGLNLLFTYNILDTRNKLYGLDYTHDQPAPVYSRDSIRALCTPDRMMADEANMIDVLERWKARQASPRPTLFLINVSGGGTRSATFTMCVLQKLDSLSGGQLMRRTFLMTGASGGMLGATYFRELYRIRQSGLPIQLGDSVYVDNISKDLLNPLFSSFVTRDILAPAQSFRVNPYTYVKDRGYAFEEQLDRNTGYVLNQRLGDYRREESAAMLPLIIYNGTISRDGRRMMMSTQPLSFLMESPRDNNKGIFSDPDAVDFATFFKRQHPDNIRILSALRVGATFPYVLPNVWLPSSPVIDLMDAGLRDNYGQETTMRFLQVFDSWIRDNTSGVVYVQIKDRRGNDWIDDFSSTPDFTEFFTRPFMTLQYNWPKLQDYSQEELVSAGAEAFHFPFKKITFTYVPANGSSYAPLNFHLTAREKLSVISSLQSPEVQASLRGLEGLLKR
ncbi:hypothetical protein [Dinghuibacter silviterrae]|uniref:Patatin-like phospholipase n=1 Tax=Dinghuibacter silviterrae TaxID=1539049 RepID=A0A4R8DP53_9BACT|nr:hypothetical protein [Dinghuibacter silviterrae]TDW99851.1 hypothetical protein EDB95_0865 [Dinghuibacter silviterrae]